MKYSQTASEPRCLVFDDGGLRRLAHDDEFLIRLHHHSRKLREPDSDVHETLVKMHWF